VSNQLVRRAGGGIERLPRQVGRAIDVQRYRALEAAARVNAAAYLAHVGMTLTAKLTAEEAQLIQMVPLAEPRLRGIVDTFALLAASTVAEMNF
jgi:hypothetical protein